MRTGAPFDVLLCDLMMPGITGMELYDLIGKEAPGVQPKMIFMTGGAFTEGARAFLGGSSNLRLQKPFTAAELERAIQQVLAGLPQ